MCFDDMISFLVMRIATCMHVIIFKALYALVGYLLSLTGRSFYYFYAAEEVGQIRWG